LIWDTVLLAIDLKWVLDLSKKPFERPSLGNSLEDQGWTLPMQYTQKEVLAEIYRQTEI
jgi:hypothetical protein